MSSTFRSRLGEANEQLLANPHDTGALYVRGKALMEWGRFREASDAFLRCNSSTIDYADTDIDVDPGARKCFRRDASRRPRSCCES